MGWFIALAAIASVLFILLILSCLAAAKWADNEMEILMPLEEDKSE